MTQKSYLSEYFLKKLGRCANVPNFQPAPISGNVINQILYLEISENNSKHVEKYCTAGLGTSKIWSLCCCTITFKCVSNAGPPCFFIGLTPCLLDFPCRPAIWPSVVVQDTLLGFLTESRLNFFTEHYN